MPSQTKQLQHHEIKNAELSSSIVLICDGVESPANAGGLIRLAEAFGVESVYFCNANINFEGNRFKRTARSADKNIRYTNHGSAEELVKELSTTGFTTIGLEITTNSLPLEDLNIEPLKKIALIIGSESMGISSSLLKILDHITHIPMYGNNSSMNVGHACAIALYKLTQPQHAPQI